MASLEVRSKTRAKVPGLPFARIAKTVLPGYDISLVFVGEAEAQSLNKTLRKKTYVPNVLSYEAGKKHGEILICLSVAKREAGTYGLSYPHYVAYLFIHGLLHLKGMRHGTTMERRERELLARMISVPLPHGTTHSNRHRSRLSSNESRHR